MLINYWAIHRDSDKTEVEEDDDDIYECSAVDVEVCDNMMLQ